jgi:hypothetical protein
MSKLFRVEVESRYTCTFYVEGDSLEGVKADAEELAGETHKDEWDDEDRDVEVIPVDVVSPGNHLWRGGPEGSWSIT